MLKLGGSRVAPPHHPRVHSMRRILAAAGWLCLGLAPLTAAESTTLSLDKLVEQLGDANFRTPEAAGNAIDARGIAVLPDLRLAAAATPSAVALPPLHD